MHEGLSGNSYNLYESRSALAVTPEPFNTDYRISFPKDLNTITVSDNCTVGVGILKKKKKKKKRIYTEKWGEILVTIIEV